MRGRTSSQTLSGRFATSPHERVTLKSLIEKLLLGIELRYRGEQGAGKVAGEQERR
jgi:hypothetical protein